MNEFIQTLFREGTELSALQMCIRSILIFFICLILIRIAGRRSFATKTAFDNIVVILLGAILSRAVVGISPFWPVVSSCFVLVMVYRLFAYLSSFSTWLSNILKGEKMILFSEGKMNEINMHRNSISEDDLRRGLRRNANTDSWENVDKAYMETSGEITIIRKNDV